MGNVHIYTTTDQAQCDHAVYDIDQSVLVMTGHDLKVTTPQDVMTARDSMEYWSQRHMAVARGNAVAITSDGRRLSGDTVVAYTTDPNAPAAPGQPAPPAPVKPAAAGTSQDPLEAPASCSGWRCSAMSKFAPPRRRCRATVAFMYRIPASPACWEMPG